MSTRNPRTTRFPAAPQRGFTIIEMLVAVAAVALLTVGILQVFRSTATTVSSGRRVSNLLTYANLLERQLREDVSHMSRRGFLVIRNEQVNAQTAPGLAIRPHRVDDLIFFTEGRYTTVRNPVNPRVIATAPAARVYYGHGLRSDPREAFSSTPPALTDPDYAQYPYFTLPGANQYAKDWILARQVTLMAEPRSTQTSIPDPQDPIRVIAPTSDQSDSAVQIAQVVAVPSIFRALARNTDISGTQSLRKNDLTGGVPSLASGLVDIAAEDLSTVRDFITSPVKLADIRSAAPAFVSGGPTVQLGGRTQVADDLLEQMRAKMQDAFPAAEVGGALGGDANAYRRIRVEETAPNALGVNFSAGDEVERDKLRSDQQMLAAHSFVPHCTGFIVEWSFGETIPAIASLVAPGAGRLIWYGYPRDTLLDTNVVGERVLPYYQTVQQLQAYVGDKAQTSQLFTLRSAPTTSAGRPLTARYRPNPNMFDAAYRLPPLATDAGQHFALYSYFGFSDPYWPPEGVMNEAATATPTVPVIVTRDARIDFLDLASLDVQNAGVNFADPERTAPTSIAILARDVNFNTVYEPQLGEVLNVPQTLPWKWPKLLRITVTLADPKTPSFERTFQFVFDLPEDPTAQRN
ncbi:hypothetical protein BH11PLA1_BH11PLA1_11530 [soil metagenome]